MSLENYTGNISDLVATNPTGTDPRSQGDDHLRGIKYTLKQSFPLATGPVRVSGDKLFAGDSADNTKNFVIDASADNGTMKIARESGQDIITVDVQGRVTLPANPAFLAGQDAATTIPNDATKTKIIFSTEVVDVGGNYDATLSRFTAPVTGMYLFTFSIDQGSAVGGQGGYLGLSLFKNGNFSVPVGVASSVNTDDAFFPSIGGSVLTKLTAGDYVEAYGVLIGGATPMQTTFYGYFSGQFMGALP